MTDAADKSNGNAIVADQLVKKFGDLVAVNEITFSVGERELFGLLGPNGAGKTTLIRMLTTLTPPTSGTALIAGHDIVTDADGVRLVIGVIPQALTSDPELTAEENMLLHAKLFGVPEIAAPRIGRASSRRRRPLEIRQDLRPQFLRRHAPQTRNRARASPFAKDSLSRRADHRPRSRLAHQCLGNDSPPARAIQAHHRPHHALHGRSRQTMRSHRHRRSRPPRRARHSHKSERQHSRRRHS